MYRSTLAALGFAAALAGCHPPDQAIYDDAKNCVGVMHVALTQVPSYQLRRAGLYYDDVNRVALESYETAWKFGANTGRTKNAIIAEVGEAKRRAWNAYALPTGSPSAKPSEKLLSAVKRCMPKPSNPNE